MQSTGRIAAVACAAQISCLVGNHHYRQCRMLKAPCNALQRQMRALEQRLHFRCASGKPEPSAAPEDVAAVDDLFQRWLRLAAAILAAACLHHLPRRISSGMRGKVASRKPSGPYFLLFPRLLLSFFGSLTRPKDSGISALMRPLEGLLPLLLQALLPSK